MQTIIHVNQQVLRRNKKVGLTDPCITVKTYKDNVYCSEVEINGPSKVVYSPKLPKACGAVCWIECDSADIKIIK